MKIQYCLFEDQFLENFHPLTLTRPVYDLRVGIFTLGEKWKYALKADRDLHGPLRQHLTGVFPEPELSPEHEGILWINPRVIPSPVLVEEIGSLEMNSALYVEEQLTAALIPLGLHQKWLKNRIDTSDLTKKNTSEPNPIVLQNVWELFQLNGRQIESDIRLVNKIAYGNETVYPHTTFIEPNNIYIDEGAVIEPGAMLLAGSGPIYIGKNAHIMANSVIRGPSAICEKSVVKMGAKIYRDTTVGPVCKVGGEISNVIFHSYSNKAHDGYAGNSVFGQWCNLGADTNTSNLKNNYSSVKVVDWKTQKEMDTGQQFIGTIMGDHSKTGINSMMNTGTLCGVCCNLFSDGYPPKFVPSFSWVSGHDIVPYHFEKAIEAMEKMMERRSVALTPAYRSMMSALFNSTSF